jgi:ATP synthase protein I
MPLWRMSKSTREAFNLLAVASSMGIAIVLATVIGLAIGYYLDKYFGTSPWLTLIFLILGIIAGFKNIWVIARRVQKMSKDDK